MSKWQDALVDISPINDPVLGQMPAFKLGVPANMSGRLDLWAVPPCEANPDGYWFALNTGAASYSAAEPGVEAWRKTLLCSIRFYSAPTGAENEMDHAQKNTVEYVHPSVQIDLEALNPNDYSSVEA